MAGAGYVPRSMLDRYNQLIRGVSEGAVGVVGRQLQILGTGDPDALKAAVKTTLAGADSAAGEVDSQFYRAARRAAIGSPGMAVYSTRKAYTDEQVDRAVDAMYRDHGTTDADGRRRVTDQQAFQNDLEQFVGRLVNDISKTHMSDYGARDPRKPRFARVPSGAETCAYCYALAGLGFQYRSRESAQAHGHASCDCVIVPSWDGSTVEGYDPERYAEMFRNARYDLTEGNVSKELRQRVYERAGNDGYTVGWKGMLAAMREIYDLK